MSEDKKEDIKDTLKINEKMRGKRKNDQSDITLEEFEQLTPSEIKVLSDDYYQYDIIFKVIIIGNSGVGKSSLADKAVRDTFDAAYQATVGFDFFSMYIKIKEKIIKLQIWDTCGQEIYRSLISNFYRNTSFAFMLYAINNKQSFDDIELWIKEVKTFSSPDSKIYLIGNKADLEKERQVTKEMGESLAKKYGFVNFFETSALTGYNTKEVFVECAKLLYKDFLKYKLQNINEEEDSTSSYIKSRTASIDKNSYCC